MTKFITIGVYRVLRKLGAKREDIMLNSKLIHLIDFDDQEWLCFYFLLESKFDINITPDEEKSLQTVAATIQLIENKLMTPSQTTTKIEVQVFALVE